MKETWHLFSKKYSKKIGEDWIHLIYKEKIKIMIHSLKAKSQNKKKKTHTSTATVFIPYHSILVISCYITNYPKA